VSLRAGASAEALPEKSRKRLRKILKFFQNSFLFFTTFLASAAAGALRKIF
jgi:hypothetical protein